MSNEKVIQDNVMPQGKWEFDGKVASCFTDMISRSIPGYQAMRDVILETGSEFINIDGKQHYVVDLGCSNGLSIEPFINRFGAHIRCFLSDVSEPMLEQAKVKYRNLIDCGIVNVENIDIVEDYPKVIAELTLCILTLQFTAPESRQQILKRIYDHTANGGALILVEKVQGSDAMTDDLLTTLYYNNKRKNGYTDTQIYTKRKSLTGELVPLKAEWNEQLLREAGFSHVECIWRNLNFMGWVAVK